MQLRKRKRDEANINLRETPQQSLVEKDLLLPEKRDILVSYLRQAKPVYDRALINYHIIAKSDMPTNVLYKNFFALQKHKKAIDSSEAELNRILLITHEKDTLDRPALATESQQVPTSSSSASASASSSSSTSFSNSSDDSTELNSDISEAFFSGSGSHVSDHLSTLFGPPPSPLRIDDEQDFSFKPVRG